MQGASIPYRSVSHLNRGPWPAVKLPNCQGTSHLTRVEISWPNHQSVGYRSKYLRLVRFPVNPWTIPVLTKYVIIFSKILFILHPRFSTFCVDEFRIFRNREIIIDEWLTYLTVFLYFRSYFYSDTSKSFVQKNDPHSLQNFVFMVINVYLN